MGNDTDYSCDLFKPLVLLENPDPRSEYTYITKTIERMHEHVSKYKLDEDIPIDIRIKFDTARNLYVYSWYAYRFNNIAQHELFLCLELGLRELFLAELPNKKEYKNRFGETTLDKLLSYAVDFKYLKNEDFENYRERIKRNSQRRYERMKRVYLKSLMMLKMLK
ncbi:MAG: hypothetical protein R8M46_06500 [Ghiorsea sp.]